MEAALTRSLETVDTLLQAAADPNIVDNDGNTALCYALSTGDLAVIDKLCPVTTTTRGRHEALARIARKRIALSGPLETFVLQCVQSTGRWGRR